MPNLTMKGMKSMKGKNHIHIYSILNHIPLYGYEEAPLNTVKMYGL